MTQGLVPEWTMKDEWYSFRSNLRARGANVIATLDERSYVPEGMGGQDLRMGDHPIAWTRCSGKGRAFYSAIGHLSATYSDPRYQMLLVNAVRWAAAAGRQGYTPNRP